MGFKKKIVFGPYEWIELERMDGVSLLISDISVERRPYHDELANTTWEYCSLRKWLNTTFLEKFNKEERERILTTVVSTPNNLEYHTIGGNDTLDKVFILDIECCGINNL